MQVEQEAIAQSDSQQLILAEEKPVEQEAIAPYTSEEVYPARPIPQAKEQYDLNLVVVSGVIGSVWGKNNDVFARLALSLRGRLVENDEKFCIAHHAAFCRWNDWRRADLHSTR